MDEQKLNAQKLAGTAENVVQEIIDVMEEKGYQVRKDPNKIRMAVKTYVKNNPFKTIGFSALIGIVIGFLWRL